MDGSFSFFEKLGATMKTNRQKHKWVPGLNGIDLLRPFDNPFLVEFGDAPVGIGWTCYLREVLVEGKANHDRLTIANQRGRIIAHINLEKWSDGEAYYRNWLTRAAHLDGQDEETLGWIARRILMCDTGYYRDHDDD